MVEFNVNAYRSFDLIIDQNEICYYINAIGNFNRKYILHSVINFSLTFDEAQKLSVKERYIYFAAINFISRKINR